VFRQKEMLLIYPSILLDVPRELYRSSVHDDGDDDSQKVNASSEHE